MMKNIALTLLAGLVIGSLALSQVAAPAADPKAINELIQQLGSTRYPERERAQKLLEGMGEQALPALRKASKEGDLEISRRAADILRRVEDKVLTANVLAPKLVNLKLDDVTVVEAINILSKQSGYPIQIDGDRGPLAQRKVTLNTGEVTFWEALDKLCSAAGLTEKAQTVANYPPSIRPPINGVPLPAPAPRVIPKVKPAPKGVLPNAQPLVPQQLEAQVEIKADGAPVQAQAIEIKVEAVQIQAVAIPAAPIAQMAEGLVAVAPRAGGPRQIVLGDGKTPPVPTCYAGAVRIRLLPPASANMQKQAGETLLVFDAAAEPRLKGFQVLGDPTISSVVDDQEQSLTVAKGNVAAPQDQLQPAAQFARIRMPPNYNMQRLIPVRLKLGDKQATKLKELRGTLTAQVQLPTEPLLTLEKVLESAGKTVKSGQGAALTLQSIEKTGDKEYRVSMTIENPNALRGGGPAVGGGFRIVANGGMVVGFNGNNDDSLPQLLDANGKAYQTTQIPNRSMQIQNGQLRQILVAVYRANGDQGEPARIVINGSRVTNVAIPFTFKDVPIP